MRFGTESLYFGTRSRLPLGGRSVHHSKMSDLIKVNLETNLVGENIDWGQKDEESVVDSWMWSPLHRWNILGSGYRKVGFGLIEDKEKRKYWCAVFSD